MAKCPEGTPGKRTPPRLYLEKWFSHLSLGFRALVSHRSAKGICGGSMGVFEGLHRLFSKSWAPFGHII